MGFSAVSAAVAVIGGVVSAAQQHSQQQAQAKAQRRQAEFNAAVARNNAIIAEQDAERIRQQGEVSEVEHRERIGQHIGASRAAMAAQGLLVDDTGDSTAQMLLADIAEQGEYDILKIRDNHAQQIRQLSIQGENFNTQAALFDLEAQNADIAASGGGVQIAGALVKAAGGVAKTGAQAGWFS